MKDRAASLRAFGDKVLLAADGVVERHRRILFFLVLLLGVVGCGLGSLALGQDNSWDLRNYHYYNVYAFLNDRMGYDYAPAQMQTYLNPFQHMPFYYGIEHLEPRQLGFLVGCFQGIGLLLIFAIAFLVFRRQRPAVRFGVSLVCAALGLYGPVLIEELGASQNDVVLGFFVLVSMYLMLRRLARGSALSAPESRRALVWSALILGLAAGLKLTFMLYAVATVATLLVIERNWRGRASTVLIWSGAFVIGFLITNGYWMYRMWTEFANPVYPFYNHIFESPWAEPKSFADRRFLPRSIVEALVRPFLFIRPSRIARLHGGLRDARYVILYIVLAIHAIVWLYHLVTSRRSPQRAPLWKLPIDQRFLLVYIVVVYVLWQFQFSILRYAVAVEALAPILIVVLILPLVSRRSLRLATVVVVAVVIADVVRPRVEHPAFRTRVEWSDTFWEVELPEIPNPDNTLVLIANPRPWSYLIPLFPPGVRFVSLHNNFTTPDDDTWHQAEMRKLIQEFRGDMFLLSREQDSVLFGVDRNTLLGYDVGVAKDDGIPIQSRHSRPGLQLWPAITRWRYELDQQRSGQ